MNLQNIYWDIRYMADLLGEMSKGEAGELEERGLQIQFLWSRKEKGNERGNKKGGQKKGSSKGGRVTAEVC